MSSDEDNNTNNNTNVHYDPKTSRLVVDKYGLTLNHFKPRKYGLFVFDIAKFTWRCDSQLGQLDKKVDWAETAGNAT